MDIGRYFERYEWACEQVEDDIWRSIFALEGDEDCDLYVMVDDPWVHFAVAPFLSAVKPDCREQIYTALLQLNQRMQWVRFALDDDGDITLLADLAGDSLNDSVFASVVDALSHYARELYKPLRRLATDPAYHWSP